MLETKIPFQGFYCSLHSEVISWALDNEAEENEQIELPEVNYPALYLAYAQEYLEGFETAINEEFDINIKLPFVNLQSPKEYNFETDSIFSNISLEDAQILKDLITPLTWEGKIKELFTSYSGFISFYSNDAEDYKKPLSSYDCNEVYVIMSCIYDELIQGKTELDLMSDTWLNENVSSFYIEGN